MSLDSFTCMLSIRLYVDNILTLPCLQISCMSHSDILNIFVLGLFSCPSWGVWKCCVSFMGHRNRLRCLQTQKSLKKSNGYKAAEQILFIVTIKCCHKLLLFLMEISFSRKSDTHVVLSFLFRSLKQMSTKFFLMPRGINNLPPQTWAQWNEPNNFLFHFLFWQIQYLLMYSAHTVPKSEISFIVEHKRFWQTDPCVTLPGLCWNLALSTGTPARGVFTMGVQKGKEFLK